ncbi:MAG: FAD:protein FMN transferase [Psychrosphaera sp.]|nr:FAD:protein FMN transferase [Psychrosphaera sp.]
MQLFEHDFKAMGSPCQIQVLVPSETFAHCQFRRLSEEVDRLEQKYSRFLPSSLLSKINQGAGSGTPTPIDHETHAILHFAQQAFELSDGLFDITSGVLRQVWDFKSANSGKERVPSDEQISTVLPLIGWEKVQWDDNTIYLPTKGMEIDFGGIVKEYTVDCCVKLLADQHIKGLVNLGGDIGVTDCAPVDHVWDVGIRHPRKGHQDKIAHVPLTKGAIAASGDYERFIEVDGIRYSHILNPKTGYPIQGLATVSLWSEKCVIAGTLATIAMLKADKGLEWLKGLEQPFVAVDNELNVYKDLGES